MGRDAENPLDQVVGAGKFPANPCLVCRLLGHENRMLHFGFDAAGGQVFLEFIAALRLNGVGIIDILLPRRPAGSLATGLAIWPVQPIRRRW